MSLPPWPEMEVVSVPGDVHRAPLRLDASDYGYAGSGEVLPVTFTGLHCGTDPVKIALWVAGVFPVTFTGLHCGWSSVVDTYWGSYVFPVTFTGLHLRRLGRAEPQLAALATSLNAWLRHLALHGDLAKAEPKALRYRLHSTPARHVVHARRRTC